MGKGKREGLFKIYERLSKIMNFKWLFIFKKTGLYRYACVNHNYKLLNKIIDLNLDFNGKPGESPAGLLINNLIVKKMNFISFQDKGLYYILNLVLSIFDFFNWDNYELNEKNNLHKIILKFKNRFEKYKINYEFVCDVEIFEKLVSKMEDVNLKFDQDVKNGWESIEKSMNDINNVNGTLLESLVLNFWLFLRLSDDKAETINGYKIYERMFNVLESYGADINKLEYKGGYDDSVKDAMQYPVIRIGTLFFCNFLKYPKYFLAIKPILKSKKTNFIIKNSEDSNLLHILFYKICGRFNYLSSKNKYLDDFFINFDDSNVSYLNKEKDEKQDTRFIQMIVNLLFLNDNFKKEMLSAENVYKSSPIKQIEKFIEKEDLKAWIDYVELSTSISLNKCIKNKKVNKI